MTVLPDSGYQHEVDVGSCEGQCSGKYVTCLSNSMQITTCMVPKFSAGANNDCVPTVNRTVAVSGPNGERSAYISLSMLIIYA